MAPDRICVPIPVLVRPPVPLITPENVTLDSLLAPTVSVAAPSVTLPAPLRPSIVSALPARSNVTPLATLTSAVSLMRFEPPSVNVPPPNVMVPVPAFRPPAAMVTLPNSTRLIPELSLVVAVIVLAAILKKLMVVPMAPEVVIRVTSLAVRSVPRLSLVVIAPLALR